MHRISLDCVTPEPSTTGFATQRDSTGGCFAAGAADGCGKLGVDECEAPTFERDEWSPHSSADARAGASAPSREERALEPWRACAAEFLSVSPLCAGALHPRRVSGEPPRFWHGTSSLGSCVPSRVLQLSGCRLRICVSIYLCASVRERMNFSEWSARPIMSAPNFVCYPTRLAGERPLRNWTRPARACSSIGSLDGRECRAPLLNA